MVKCSCGEQFPDLVALRSHAMTVETLWWTLDGHNPMPLHDASMKRPMNDPVKANLMLAINTQLADPNVRRVAEWHDVGHGVSVSTVFLFLDHQWAIGGPPLLFETMVFGGPLNHEMERYSTWDEAQAGHDEMVKRVMRAVAPRGEQRPPRPRVRR